jgi:Na+/proline symporter
MSDAANPNVSPTPPTPPPPMPVAGRPPKGPIGQARPIGMTILLTIITCGIYGLYWEYMTFEELKQHNGKGLGGVLGLIIGIFVGIVNWFVLPAEIQATYQDDGRPSPVSPIIGLWFLLPIVGGIIWFVKVQGALNDYWVSKGAQPV